MADAKRLIIIGASGHGRVAADIAELSGFGRIAFLDDRADACAGPYPVLGPVSMSRELDGPFFVAVGSSAARRRITEMLSGKALVTLIHPQAAVARTAEVGPGSIVMACAAVNPGAKLGMGCIVNTCASVDHDCVIGDFVHVAVGAHICGTVNIGPDTWVGAGATVINNVDICGGCTIGAGAAVVRGITLPGTYMGVPARLVKRAEGVLSV